MDYLFVYGTLQAKFKNEYAQLLHSKATIIGEAYFYGKLFLIDYYPGAIADLHAQSKVYGTLFKLNENHQLLKDLDEYEEVGEAYEQPNEYIRENIHNYNILFNIVQILFFFIFFFRNVKSRA